ncbi:hypothetical protein Pse7367_2625 [Thalassoporum mexicanum PCC 7367]|uniref:zinc-dependent metalloprotease n=1 Tax=Thalassoporum mexicanum TaxID=3457544 RepID=UPI00029FF74A|nr:zinc-dependent metalloprotease [Pseudanabaena sp. PCC 7367]AFY70881.1 hypothetical protein Pse7367_2625 [Pseudanabaena sp. PCC 7367]
MTKRHFWRWVGLSLILAIACSYLVQPAQLWGQNVAKMSQINTQGNQKRRVAEELRSPQLPQSLPNLNQLNQAKPKKADKPDLEDEKDEKKDNKDDKSATDDDLKPFAEVIKDTEKQAGLFTIYAKDDYKKLYLELDPNQLDRNFLLVASLASGVGEAGLYRGLPVNDFLFQLRRVNNSIQLVLPNINFRASANDPQVRSVRQSFSDSVLASVPILSIHAQNSHLLIDFKQLLNNDLANLNSRFAYVFDNSYSLSKDNSYIAVAKALPLNVETELVYQFASENPTKSRLFNRSLPDDRSFDLKVRYSISQLPDNSGYNGYVPRLADNRVGYFISAYKDFSTQGRDSFVRYIERWHLQKQDPAAALSPPKEPIVFWIENTVPNEYRDPIREGALMWNHAFEKVGFKDAIVIKQMPDDATWDPEDVRYNTIRWFNSIDTAFAMGPSRVNPLTGQILDADIIIDANIVKFTEGRYRDLVQQTEAIPFLPQVFTKLTGNPFTCNTSDAMRSLQSQLAHPNQAQANLLRRFQQAHQVDRQELPEAYEMCFGMAAAQELATGSLSMSLLQNALPSSKESRDYVNQFLRELTAHEVGHTLGLRHNFRASAMLSPAELNDPAITKQKGLVASVMDYHPVNIAPSGTEQGEYFTSVVGPYDEWAIAYGYTPFEDVIIPAQEQNQLNRIANRAPEADLAYATDEDTYGGLDPHTNLFDLSNDLVTYAQWQMDNARQMWRKIETRYPGRGESYDDVRVAFDRVFNYYFRNAMFLPNYIGGQRFNRYKSGDAVGRLPFEPIPASKQREALAVINKNVFAADAFDFSPEFLNRLAPSRWSHWGETPSFSAYTYPIHERIKFLQTIVLADLLSADRLARLRDNELKTSPGQALTLPELFSTLQQQIWSELSSGQLESINSIRRSLQRQHMNILISIALRPSNLDSAADLADAVALIYTAGAPEDARAIARYQLRQLKADLEGVMGRRNLDDYTRIHLSESRDRIAQALNASLNTN